MPKTDPLDRPVTLRELKDAFENNQSVALPNGLFTKTVATLVAKAEADAQTDYVSVTFGGNRTYPYKIAEQPARRVQVGDLVTTGPNAYSSAPQVARVVAVDLPKSKYERIGALAVAISPEDAKRIEAALGKVK